MRLCAATSNHYSISIRRRPTTRCVRRRLQFVRKVSGFTKPSKANEEAFNEAVDEVTEAARKLIAVAGDDRCAEGSRRGSGQGA